MRIFYLNNVQKNSKGSCSKDKTIGSKKILVEMLEGTKKNNHKKAFQREFTHSTCLFIFFIIFLNKLFSFSLFVFSQANSCAQGSRHFYVLYLFLLNRNKMYHNFVNTQFYIKTDLLLEKVSTKNYD